MHHSVAGLTVLLYSAMSYVIAQAPGDGDPLCVDEVLNGEDNPIFDLHPTYAANERPLMDSRDYISLLQGHNPTWQMVDNDNNNTGTVITSVSSFLHKGLLSLKFSVITEPYAFTFPLLSYSGLSSGS